MNKLIYGLLILVSDVKEAVKHNCGIPLLGLQVCNDAACQNRFPTSDSPRIKRRPLVAFFQVLKVDPRSSQALYRLVDGSAGGRALPILSSRLSVNRL